MCFVGFEGLTDTKQRKVADWKHQTPIQPKHEAPRAALVVAAWARSAPPAAPAHTCNQAITDQWWIAPLGHRICLKNPKTVYSLAPKNWFQKAIEIPICHVSPPSNFLNSLLPMLGPSLRAKSAATEGKKMITWLCHCYSSGMFQTCDLLCPWVISGLLAVGSPGFRSESSCFFHMSLCMAIFFALCCILFFRTILIILLWCTRHLFSSIEMAMFTMPVLRFVCFFLVVWCVVFCLGSVFFVIIWFCVFVTVLRLSSRIV